MKNKKIWLITGTIFVLAIIACATSPTGRRQLIRFSDEEMNKMGVQAFEDIKKKTPVETGAGPNNYVKCITGAILAVTKDDTGVKSWEVVVFREPKTVNAFALPGGKIGVYTGIFPVASTPGQLAAVLGHEVAHVIARHGNERVSQDATLQQVSGALGGISDSKVFAGAIGAGAQFGVLLPFSRAHESEADIVGLELMAKAGFNPAESIRLWENMKAASGGNAPPQIISTHPSNETRIAQLKQHLPQANTLYEQAKSSGKNPNCTL